MNFTEETIITKLIAEGLQSAWIKMPSRTKNILAQRNRGKTLSSIGENLKITRERIRQIEKSGKEKFYSNLRYNWEAFDLLKKRMHTNILVLDISHEIQQCENYESACIYVPIIFEYEGWSPYINGSVWWVKDTNKVSSKVDSLIFKEPMRREEWLSIADESKLPHRFIDWLINKELVPIKVYRNYIVSSNGFRRDKVYIYLLEHGKAHVTDIANAISEPTPRNLDAFMGRQSIFTKIYPGGQWSLHGPSEVRYVKAIDALLDILRDQGPILKRDLLRAMKETFPVSPGRIDQCLTDYRIGQMPDGKIWLVEHGAERGLEEEPSKPDHIESSGDIVGIRRKVSADVFRGSGLMDSRWLAWKLGLYATPMEKVFSGLEGLPYLRVSRQGANSAISSIREAILNRNLYLGCSFIILLDLNNATWKLKHTCEQGACRYENV